MEKYVLNNFRKHIKDATLQETVLDEHLVPNNVTEAYPKKFDSFIKYILSEQRKNGRG